MIFLLQIVLLFNNMIAQQNDAVNRYNSTGTAAY